MSFLIPYIKERETISSVNVAIHEESLGEDTQYSRDLLDVAASPTDNQDGMNFVQPIPTHELVPSNKTPVRSNAKRKRPESASGVLMDFILNNRSQPATHENKDACALDLFFSSIAKTVKTFSPYNQALAKSRVFSIISELEISELSQTQIGSTISHQATILPSAYSTRPVESHEIQAPSPSTSLLHTNDSSSSSASHYYENYAQQ